MKRLIQIYIDEEALKFVDGWAEQHNISRGEVIRQSLEYWSREGSAQPTIEKLQAVVSEQQKIIDDFSNLRRNVTPSYADGGDTFP